MDIGKTTTIKIEKETKSRIDKFKEHERESYEEVLKKILYIINVFRKNPVLGNKILNRIDKNIKIKQDYYKQIKQAV